MIHDKMHFATTKPANGSYQVYLGEELILESEHAVLLDEHRKGDDLASVVYFPESDIAGLDTSPSVLTTHCPIKGDASYLNFRSIENGLWCYADPVPGVLPIKGHFAFDLGKGFRVVAIR